MNDHAVRSLTSYFSEYELKNIELDPIVGQQPASSKLIIVSII